MSRQQERTSIRILSLALNLLNTKSGCSRAQVRELMDDYGHMTEASFQRTFERDIASLREAGLNVELLGEDTPRYRIRNRRRNQPVELTATELRVLSFAASAWDFGSPAELSRLTLKLNSKLAAGERGVGVSSVEGRLEGAEHLRPILAAIGLRQPISFLYAARHGETEQRDVAALSLIVRGRAVYLWGYDFNREGDRRFRLSRIMSPIELVAEPDCYDLPAELPPELGDQTTQFDVSPLLWVREGAAPLVRLRAEAEHASREVAPGWELLRGNAGDWGAWERLLIENASDCVVAAPDHLRDRVRSLLQAAADSPLEGGPEHGE